MKLLLKLAYKNILNYSKQSKSTLLSISAAFISLVLFQGYIKDADYVMEDEFSKRTMMGDFLFENKDYFSVEGKKEPWKFNLTVEEQNLIKSVIKETVDKEAPICSALRINGMIQKKAKQFVFVGIGYDVDGCRKVRMPHWENDALYGKPFYQSQSDDVIILGQTLAKNFDCVKKDKNPRKSIRLGYGDALREYECTDGDQFSLSALTVHSQINSIDLSMIGIMDGGFIDMDARVIQIPLNKAQELYDTDTISYMTIISEKLAKDRKLQDKVRKMLPNNIIMVNWKEHKVIGDFYRRIMGLLGLLKIFVVIIVLVIVSLSIMNSLLKTIKERTKEIGTMRSIGYTKSMIRNIFFMEVAILSFFGVVIGAILSAIITIGINNSGISYKAGQFVESSPMTIALDPLNYLLVMVYIFILAMAGCYFVIKGTLNKTVAENFIHV